MPRRTYFVYILSSRTRCVYVGVTGCLDRRLAQHRTAAIPGFTTRYGVSRLVHVEAYDDPVTAISREKQLKRWPRWRKDRLIARGNPAWHDLTAEWER